LGYRRRLEALLRDDLEVFLEAVLLLGAAFLFGADLLLGAAFLFGADLLFVAMQVLHFTCFSMVPLKKITLNDDKN
jgi:hypothetical protein